MPIDSHTPIPRLRADLELLPIKDDGKDFLLLRDPAGYADEMLVFRPEAWALLSLFDGSRSVDLLRREILEATRVNIDESQLLDIVQALDRYHFLDNEAFRSLRDMRDEEYALEPVRNAVYAGQAYPEDADELKAFLTGLFDADTGVLHDGHLLGVIAPHIDLQIGPQVYVPAFRHLESADIDTVVVLGTSHYSADDMFIMTSKSFSTPLGIMPTDTEFINEVRNRSGGVLTTRDTAHRMEHSIEFPILFLQHVFGNERVRIVPVLCTSFDDNHDDGNHTESSERYKLFTRAFRESIASLDRRVAYVLSVDWSHVGRKFGDPVDAEEILDEVRRSDHEHFSALERCDFSSFAEMLRTTENATHIDGYSCIATFFELAAPGRGVLLDYQQWHEIERASSVSFASMAFFKE